MFHVYLEELMELSKVKCKMIQMIEKFKNQRQIPKSPNWSNLKLWKDP